MKALKRNIIILLTLCLSLFVSGTVFGQTTTSQDDWEKSLADRKKMYEYFHGSGEVQTNFLKDIVSTSEEPKPFLVFLEEQLKKGASLSNDRNYKKNFEMECVIAGHMLLNAELSRQGWMVKKGDKVSIMTDGFQRGCWALPIATLVIKEALRSKVKYSDMLVFKDARISTLVTQLSEAKSNQGVVTTRDFDGSGLGSYFVGNLSDKNFQEKLLLLEGMLSSTGVRGIDQYLFTAIFNGVLPQEDGSISYLEDVSNLRLASLSENSIVESMASYIETVMSTALKSVNAKQILIPEIRRLANIGKIDKETIAELAEENSELWDGYYEDTDDYEDRLKKKDQKIAGLNSEIETLGTKVSVLETSVAKTNKILLVAGIVLGIIFVIVMVIWLVKWRKSGSDSVEETEDVIIPREDAKKGEEEFLNVLNKASTPPVKSKEEQKKDWSNRFG
ncbi:hypothetical protein ACFLY7_00050 [Patescibacteria group bacterium]